MQYRAERSGLHVLQARSAFYPINGSRVHLSNFACLCHCRRKTIRSNEKRSGTTLEYFVTPRGNSRPRGANSPSALMNILKRSFCNRRRNDTSLLSLPAGNCALRYHISRKLKTSIEPVNLADSLDGRDRASQTGQIFIRIAQDTYNSCPREPTTTAESTYCYSWRCRSVSSGRRPGSSSV